MTRNINIALNSRSETSQPPTETSKVEELELDLSKSEFLTEVDPLENIEDMRGTSSFGQSQLNRPRSSKIIKNDA